MLRHLAILIACTASLAAQSVGDFSVPYKSNSTGPATEKHWSGGNSKLWGTNSSGNPVSITLGTGLNFSGTTLNSTASGAWADITGTPTTLAGYGITDALTASNNLSDLGSAATARSNLGLGALATQNNITTGQIAGSIGSGNKLVAITSGLTGTTLTVGTGLTNTGTDLQLATTAVTAGSYTAANITVDAYGRITAASNGSSGLTIGTTAVSGGSANDLLISNGTTLQKITPGTGVATALTQAANASGGFVTGSSIASLVTGPASATDNAIMRYDGTTGKLAQSSTVTVSDTGYLSGVTDINGSSYVNINVNGVNKVGVGGGAMFFYDPFIVFQYVRLKAISDPGSAAADEAWFFARKNGSNKMEFCIRFPSGSIQILATEP